MANEGAAATADDTASPKAENSDNDGSLTPPPVIPPLVKYAPGMDYKDDELEHWPFDPGTPSNYVVRRGSPMAYGRFDTIRSFDDIGMNLTY